MEAPPVQYAKTRDGYDIAYNVAGSGPALLTLPYPFSHARLSWTAPGLCESTHHLAQKFRVVHFDARGQGLSSRGLADTHRVEDYLLDVDAVADALNLDRFLLFGGIGFWRAAVAYASRNQARVDALILLNPGPSASSGDPHPRGRAATGDWETYLITAGSTFGPAPTDTAGRLLLRERMKECADQSDYLRMLDAFAACDPSDWLASIEVPTLVVRQHSPWDVAGAPEIAASIPGARLVLLEDYGSVFYSPSDEMPSGITAIEEFVAGLPRSLASHGAADTTATLSPRQLEVLRLIGDGKTNRQIAEALVLSERTVERHVADVYDKIGAANRAQAAVYAQQHGIV